MTFNRRAMLSTALMSAAACVTLNLWSGPVLGQEPGGSGPRAAAQPGHGARLFTADPRAQLRTYHLDGANIDVPYCVFVSSKVSRSKPAPLIISLHGLGAGPQIMCNTAAIDLAEQGGYILAAPMGYSVGGWYGSPVINMGAGRRPRGPGGATGAGSDEVPHPSPTPAPESVGTTAAPGPSNQDIEKWSEADVMNVLAMMRKEFKVDPKRIYLTGHSMGGAGTLFLASQHPQIWAAVAPVAPASFMMNANRADILKKIKDGGVALLIVQGDADTVVAPSNTRMWADSAKQLGMDFQYVELPGIDHGPVITASQQAVYAFFAQHAKQ